MKDTFVEKKKQSLSLVMSDMQDQKRLHRKLPGLRENRAASHCRDGWWPLGEISVVPHCGKALCFLFYGDKIAF